MEQKLNGNGMRMLWLSGLLMAGSEVSAMQNPGEYLSYNWKNIAIQPQFDTTALFTDNLFYNQGVNRVSDVVFTVSPGVRFQYGRDGENQVSLDYMHDETFLVEYSDFNTRQNRLDFAVRYSRGNVRVDGRDQVYFLSGLLGGAANQSRRLVDRVNWNDNYTVTYDWTEKTDFYVRGTHRTMDYDAQTTLLDQTTLEGLLGTSYQFSPKFRLTVEGFYGNTAISPNAGRSTGPDSRYYGGFAGIRGAFTPKLSGSVRLGYEQRDFSSGDSASASTPAIATDLTYQFSNMTTAVLRYDRRTFPSPQFANQLSVSDAVTFQVIQLLGSTGRWLARGSVRFDNNDLTATTIANGGGTIDVERTDKTLAIGAALVYQPQPWLSCIAAYEFEDFNLSFKSNAAAGVLQLVPYHNNRVSLSVAIGF